MALVDPVILIPGITATNLRDQYPLKPEIVWELGVIPTKKYDRITLHPNNMKFEADEPARVKSDYLTPIAYNEIVEELRYNLSEKADEPVPVFPFPYDWRQPLDIIEAELETFIEEVIERTKLLRHYDASGYGKNKQGKVNFVAHSMGGLIISGYLERKGASAPVNKVVTLATPFQGSLESVISLSTGTANMGTSQPSSRERETSRMTPALYHLLPAFKEGISIANGLPDSLFKPGVWQPSITESISEFIRLKGLPVDNLSVEAKKIFKNLLKIAKEHNDRITDLNLQRCGLTSNDWLAIVGVGTVTRTRLNIVKRDGNPDFKLKKSDRKNNWKKGRSPKERRDTGDGTVPFAGAIPPFLKEENLVLVTPDDYGYWEVQDKVFTKASGFHGILPNMNMLHRMIVRFFTGKADTRDNTWGRKVPGVSNWKPPLPLREES